MKRFSLSIAAALVCGSMCYAQSLKVTQGQVSTVWPLEDVGEMTFLQTSSDTGSSEEGIGVSIGGKTYAVSTISQMEVGNSSVTAGTVSISYTEDDAQVVIAGDVAPYLTVTASGGNVSILAADGLSSEITYELGGLSTNGSFYMDGSYKATIRINNLTLNNPSGAAIDIACGKRINVEIPDGTVSTLTDGAGGGQKACLFINGHAEFKGGGTLNLTGNAKHAYASDEYTELGKSFGTLNVNSAASDGLHVQQYFQMEGGVVNVKGTQGDCIDVGITKNAEDEKNGQVLVSGGQLTLDVAADDVKGIKCDSTMTISGGTINADVSGLGTKGISVGTDLLINETSGNDTKITMNVTGTTYMPGDEDLESKCRGMKIKGNFTFDGGTISMTVTGKKAKGISCDGTYTYISGTTNVIPE